MKKLIRKLRGLKRRYHLFLINHLYAGTHFFEKKRRLLNSLGYEIGENTKVVGPIECTGTLIVGKNCWLGKNLKVNGNGRVVIGDNVDIGPEVTFQTGGHKIGTADRRAGEGCIFSQSVGSGTWLGGGYDPQQYRNRRVLCDRGLRLRCFGRGSKYACRRCAGEVDKAA